MKVLMIILIVVGVIIAIPFVFCFVWIIIERWWQIVTDLWYSIFDHDF